MANYLVTDTQLTSIADAIRAKGGTNASLSYPTGFINAIRAISSAPASISKKDVNFFDYDGTVLYSYSAAEFANLSELPANPTHEGLVAQGWNWNLTDSKTYVASYGKLNIGQSYITASGATEIDIEMNDGRLSPILSIAVNGTVNIDWGDGTVPDEVTGTSLTTRLDPTHTYARAGNYIIKISETTGSEYSFCCDGSYTLLRKNATSNENKIYANCIKNVRIGSGIKTITNNAFQSCYSLANITIPDGVTSIGSYTFQYCYSLVNIIIPDGVTSIGSDVFLSCYSLANITIPDSVTSIGGDAFSNCRSLANITIPSNVTSIGGYAFEYCHSFANITIPSNVTNIGSYAFQSCYGIAKYHLLPTTPPTLTNINAFSKIPSDCIIYVPYSADHSVLNAYGTANNWSTYASYMKEEGENGLTWAEYQALEE